MTQNNEVKHQAPDLSHEDSLASYLHKIKHFPLLTEEEEYTLVKQWYEKGDRQAMEKIVNSHLRLLPKIAAGYRGYGLSFHDLIAEGHIGLMQALRGFHPEKGARFSTYSTWWIKASMKDYIMRSWSLVRTGTTAAQKKLFFNLRSLKEKLAPGDQTLSAEHIAHVAHKLQVSPEDVMEMEKRLASPDYSLNTTIGTGEDLEWQDWLADENVDHEEKLIQSDDYQKKMTMLTKALEILTPNEFTILKFRRLSDPPKTLEDIGIELNLSRERVRQIEVNAFTKIQKSVRNQARLHEVHH